MSADHERALSVVVAATDSTRAVRRTLASLGRTDPLCIEVIVVAPDDPSAPPGERSAGIVHVAAPRGVGVPRLRRLGLDAARGRVVAFTEDSCTLHPGWADAWVEAFAAPETLAATGPVVPAMGACPIDQAVFACEYAAFLPDGRSGPPKRLAGNNFAVRRTVADRLDPVEVHEGEIITRVPRTDGAFRLVGGAVVSHARQFSPAEALRDRLRFGRDYGRRRASAWPWAVRTAGVLAGPAVWVVQVIRVTWTLLRNQRDHGPLLESLPLTLALLVGWSVGEWMGCAGAWAVGFAAAFRPRYERAARPRGRPSGRFASLRPRCTSGPPSA